MKKKITISQLKRLVKESNSPTERNVKKVMAAVRKFNELRQQALDKIGDEGSLYYETGSTLQSGPQYISKLSLEGDDEKVVVKWVEEESVGWNTRRVPMENKAMIDDDFEIDNLLDTIKYQMACVKKALKYYEKLNPDNEEQVLKDLEQDDEVDEGLVVKEEFDISKYITALDVASAVTAGIIAYATFKNNSDEPQPEAQPKAQPKAVAPTGKPSWGSQEWRDEMIRQGKLVKRDGMYFRVDGRGYPTEALKFYNDGSYAKLPVDPDEFGLKDIGDSDWFDFDRGKAVLVKPDGSAWKLDGKYIDKLEAVLDKNFSGKEATDSVLAQVNRAKILAQGLDPEVAAAQGLHDGTGKAFTSLGSSPAPRPAATGIPSKVTITNKDLANELLSGPSPTSVWKPDGSFDFSAVHWKSVPGRGMVPFGPDKQPLTGQALKLAQQLRSQAAASARAAMGMSNVLEEHEL